jgi:hypothetical protein
MSHLKVIIISLEFQCFRSLSCSSSPTNHNYLEANISTFCQETDRTLRKPSFVPCWPKAVNYSCQAPDKSNPKTYILFNRSHTDVFVLILKIRISQNTSIYCQYVSWQLVSTTYSHHQANTEPYQRRYIKLQCTCLWSYFIKIHVIFPPRFR